MGTEGSIFDNKISILSHTYLSGSLKYCDKETLYKVFPIFELQGSQVT